ncbi:MAG: phage protein [Bacilli bacterium]
MAGKTISSYVPSAITIVISHPKLNISHVITNLNNDSLVSIEYPEQTWTNTTSADGYTTRTHRLDKTVQMTINLEQTSRSNDVLSALLRNDENDLTGLDGIFTCTFADKSGSSYVYSSQCYVSRPQTQEFGASVGTRSWMITFAWADQWIGGSGLIDPETVQVLETMGINIDDKWKSVV